MDHSSNSSGHTNKKARLHVEIGPFELMAGIAQVTM